MKIKILYVNGAIMNRGGMEAYMMNYLRHIDTTQFQIDFLVHGYGVGAYDEEIGGYGSKIYHLPVKSKHPIQYGILLRKTLLENKYDIIHSHIDAMSCWVLKVAKECNIPVRIAHSHNTNHLTNNKMKYMINELARKNITRYATHCFACSEAAGRWLFGESSFKVIRNAIEINKFKYSSAIRESVRSELQISEHEFVIGHVGRFDYQKNHQFLLDAFYEAQKYNFNMKLLLIGDGFLRQEMEEKVSKLGIQDKVLFLGNRGDVYKFYSAMDLFVLPSLFEGLGIVLIEAQANGLFSLASDAVPREVNHDNAVKFYELSKEIWVEQILTCTKNGYGKRKQYGEALESDGYDIYVAARQLANKYLELVKK